MKFIYNLVSPYSILNYFGKDPILSRKKYYEFVKSRTLSNPNEIDIDSFEFTNARTNYISGKKTLIRTINPECIINFICKKVEIDNFSINLKYNKKVSDYKSLCILIMHGLCNLKYTEICNITRNLTLSALSRLCAKGYDLISSNEKYRNVVLQFMDEFSILTA